MALRTFAACLLLLSGAAAEDWAGAARRLAREAAQAGPREPAALLFENRSSAPPAEAAAARRALEVELRRAGWKLVTSGAVAEIRSVLSENRRAYVWTIELRAPGERLAAAASLPRAAAPREFSPALRLDASLVWSQPERILDFAFLAPDRVLLLDVTRAALLRRREEWTVEATAPLPVPAPLPRDPRGRVQAGGSAWTASLPGVLCTGTIEPLAASCRASAEPWPTPAGPARLAEGRNYFEGPVPFYSAASWDGAALLAGLDRRVHLDGEAIAAWGSDLAAVSSDCGASQQVLATRAGDDGDAVTAYDLPARRPVAVSNSLEFPGPVTALWSAGSLAAAVVFNPKSAEYEAHSLAIRCGR